MKSNNEWRRVNRRFACPICGKPDWCLVSGEPSNPEAVICARTENARRCGAAGWLHILRPGRAVRRVRHVELSAAKIGAEKSGNLDLLATDCAAAVRPDELARLAVGLGVSAESLRRLRVGWSAGRRAWTFPMTDPAGVVLGIRLRLPNGRKLAVRGGHEGLFIPTGLPTEGAMLLVCEGATDCAAMLDLDLGFAAVGRPSCAGGVGLLCELARQWKPSGVVIVADGDRPGRLGAMLLQATLAIYCVSGVKLIQPPDGVKDAREWKRLGATAADVQQAIDAADARKVKIEIRMKG